jgi:hypothetical protein
MWCITSQPSANQFPRRPLLGDWGIGASCLPSSRQNTLVINSAFDPYPNCPTTAIVLLGKELLKEVGVVHGEERAKKKRIGAWWW